MSNRATKKFWLTYDVDAEDAMVWADEPVWKPKSQMWTAAPMPGRMFPDMFEICRIVAERVFGKAVTGLKPNECLEVRIEITEMWVGDVPTEEAA